MQQRTRRNFCKQTLIWEDRMSCVRSHQILSPLHSWAQKLASASWSPSCFRALAGAGVANDMKKPSPHLVASHSMCHHGALVVDVFSPVSSVYEMRNSPNRNSWAIFQALLRDWTFCAQWTGMQESVNWRLVETEIYEIWNKMHISS